MSSILPDTVYYSVGVAQKLVHGQLPVKKCHYTAACDYTKCRVISKITSLTHIADKVTTKAPITYYNHLTAIP